MKSNMNIHENIRLIPLIVSVLLFLTGLIVTQNQSENIRFLFIITSYISILCSGFIIVPDVDYLVGFGGSGKLYKMDAEIAFLFILFISVFLSFIVAVCFIVNELNLQGALQAVSDKNVSVESGKGTIDIAKYGQSGDFIGGYFNPLISTVTLILVFAGYMRQKEELRNSETARTEQREDNAKGLYLNYLQDQFNYWSDQYHMLDAISSMQSSLDSGMNDIYAQLRVEAQEECDKYRTQRDTLAEELRKIAKL